MVLATEKTPREDANAEDEAACGRHTSQTACLSSINYGGGISYSRSEVVDGEDQIRFWVNLHICKGVAGCCYSRNMHHEL
ncbi:hypothetical protein Bca4012_023863 [Brassica carinata]